MTQEEYLKAFEGVLLEMASLTAAKNSDYASTEDAFANFSEIDKLTGGRISTVDGLLVRMTDKWKRMFNLLGKSDAAVKDETVEDTVRDLAVYAVILLIKLRQGQTGVLVE